MTANELSDPLRRLQILQQDLNVFTESRLPNVERLADQLDASAEDFRRLLERKHKNDASRAVLSPNTSPQPDTVTIDDIQYRIADQFRQNALQVADELNLDELEAAKLCIDSQVVGEDGGNTLALAMRAVLRFHEQRQALLECLRIFLKLGVDPEDELDTAAAFNFAIQELIQGEGGGQNQRSAYWRKCLDGLADIENFLKKISEHRDKLIVTGQSLSGDQGEWLVAQRLLLTRQHESMAAILSYLSLGDYAQPQDYRGFLSRAASLESEMDIAIHYVPILASGAAYFNSNQTTREAAQDLHNLFASGPGQLQWRQQSLKAAATVFWLAEYSAGFAAGSIEINQSEADRDRDEENRSKLCFDSLKDKAFHFMLTAAAYLKPVVWHDPARTALVDFLVDSAVVIPSDSPRPSDDFSTLTMRTLQEFVDAFVTNMPDALRKLKLDEDDWRRNHLSQSRQGNVQIDLDLERFMVIMACAYQDDADAARDFWKDRESNLYGFLRWVSQRLPTPRVAAFCHLLRCIACDDRSANDAHRFLREDVAMASGKLRKTFSVSWTQIFSELELYAASVKEQPAPLQSASGQARSNEDIAEPETDIMLDSYLGLATHICRISPEARSWLLEDQSFHLGEVMFQLARSADIPRLRACCLDLLSALLTDKSSEVRNGIWVLLDSWLSSGGLDGSSMPRTHSRPQYPAKQYLQTYADSAEASLSLIGLFNALISPMGPSSSEQTIDTLPFPENLGAPHRHGGITVYVDFVMDSILARKIPRITTSDSEASLIDLLRFQCLEFAFVCLSSFNEDLVLLANTTSIGVESTMETKSLATYARLHPFARIMEWLFDKGVLGSLFAILYQSLDALDDADPNSPLVQSVLKTIQVLNLAWKLQPTYHNLIRPGIAAQAPRGQPVSSTWSSLDEVFLTHLDTIAAIAQLMATRHVELGLESLTLLQRIASSRKIAETGIKSSRVRYGSRITSIVSPMSPSLTLQLAQNFILYPWDLETSERSLKVIKARAILDLLSSSLDAASGNPSLAHCLLGFSCRERLVEIVPNSAFDVGESLFHSIVKCAVAAPTIAEGGFTSWLLSLKRGCLEVILKLAVPPLTSRIVQPELRSMEFLAALSKNQTLATATPSWDHKPLLDSRLLLDTSAAAVRDFMRVREAYFEFAAVDLRSSVEQGSYSVQEKIASTLLGTIRLANGEEDTTTSILELFDFFDLGTAPPFEAQNKFFDGADVYKCTKDDPDTVIAFDVDVAEELLILRKRELKEKGVIKDASDGEAADNEIRAILAALVSQNNFATIQSARLDALEAWTDLLSLLITKGGYEQNDIVALSLQGLLIALPKFEKSLGDSLEAAARLAKLSLTFTHAISPACQDASEQTASVATERLLSTFRISLKAIADSSTDLALRDIAYRTNRAILASLTPTSPAGKGSSPSSKQLLQLVQNGGERLIGVVTEDAFSGRGVTRVSALLFLDGLLSLFQSLKVNSSMLRALMKLNFVPVLIDNSIGNVSSAFQGEDEMVVTFAYFHTALALLLRLCQTADGTQLVLNSGLFQAIDDSKLFSTDPDIGLDIDNPDALKQFYAILADVLRLITVAVVQKGPQPGKAFLQQHRLTVQTIFKQASKGQASEVADELSRLILATDFLEDEVANSRKMTNGFS